MKAWSRADWCSLVFTSAIAVLLAIAPHLAARTTVGTWEYVASGDDVFYLAVARARTMGSLASGTHSPPDATG